MITERISDSCLSVSLFLFCLFLIFFHELRKYFYRKISFTLLNVFLRRAVGRENNTPNQRERHLLGTLLEQHPYFIVHVLSATVKFSVSVTGTWKSVSAVHNSYCEMKFILCFLLCVCCHLLIHISLNQLRYLSGFTRSL